MVWCKCVYIEMNNNLWKQSDFFFVSREREREVFGRVCVRIIGSRKEGTM